MAIFIPHKWLSIISLANGKFTNGSVSVGPKISYLPKVLLCFENVVSNLPESVHIQTMVELLKDNK